jgi:hypothetical protein
VPRTPTPLAETNFSSRSLSIMRASLRTLILTSGACVLSAARPPAAPNPLTVVVVNGPYAGTYHARADEVVCLHSKAQKSYAASFKDFEASSPRGFAEGGLNVDNPDVAGPKKGRLLAAFGTKDKRSAEYDVMDAPITMTLTAKGADFAGTGKTKDGIQIRVTASCVDVMTL